LEELIPKVESEVKSVLIKDQLYYLTIQKDITLDSDYQYDKALKSKDRGGLEHYMKYWMKSLAKLHIHLGDELNKTNFKSHKAMYELPNIPEQISAS